MDRSGWIERERQWKRFHEWERTLTSTASLQSRVRWFAQALEIARRFQAGRSDMPSTEKIQRVRALRNAFAKIKVV